MRIRTLTLVLAGALAGATAVWGQAAYPTKAIEVVNSFAPGGANDLNVRAMEVVAQRFLKQPLVQSFKQGGGGITGATEVAHAAPDGYKLLVVSSGELTAAPNLTKTAYSLDSFAFIARISVKPYALTVKAGAPWKDFNEFRQRAKEQPGKLSVGTTPRGGIYLTLQYLLKQSGISLNPVPYGGSGPYIVALLGGQVDSAMAPLAALESHLAAGTLRLLGVTGPTRSPSHPTVPTFKELDVDVPLVQWIGLVGPRRIPPERLAFLRDAFERLAKDPAFAQGAQKLGVDAAHLSGEAFEQAVREEDAVFKTLVKELGLAPK